IITAYYLGYSNCEIAKVIKCNYKTVKNILNYHFSMEVYEKKQVRRPSYFDSKRLKYLKEFILDGWHHFTKAELCEAWKKEKEQKMHPKIMISDILAQSSYWLGLDEENQTDSRALNIQNFAASDGWLQGFKKRHYIVYTSHCGEAASAPIERLPEFHLSLQNETSNYEPSKSFTHGRISGIKKPKNQVTVMLTCNAVDQHMRYTHRKILLLLDNCSAHSIEGLNLRNVKVVFLPERTTAWLQPCDASIIYSFKCHYHKLLLQNRIAAFDKSNLTNQPPDPVTIYDVIQFVAQAWNKVSKDTIIHSWHKTGILPSMETNEDPNLETIDLTNEEEIELENLISRFQILKNSENSEDLNISLHEFIEIDNNYTTGEMPTIEDIIAEIQKNKSEEESEQQIKPVTAIQAITGLDSVLGYIEQSEPSIEIDIKVFAELKRI
ncbi:27286_t:CDS:2, partial [Dentiscutata erythropus]